MIQNVHDQNLPFIRGKTAVFVLAPESVFFEQHQIRFDVGAFVTGPPQHGFLLLLFALRARAWAIV